MTWLDWLNAIASAVAVVSAVIALGYFVYKKRKAYLREKELQRWAGIGEKSALRDIASGMYDDPDNGGTSN